MSGKKFIVEFEVPEDELEQYRQVAAKPDLGDIATMAGLLQRDLYDELGMSGQFKILEVK